MRLTTLARRLVPMPTLREFLRPGTALLLSLAALTAVNAPAASADEVVVLYNSRVPVSRDIAEHYAARRSVPPRQVLGIALPEGESIRRDEFESRLERRLLRFLEQRELMTFTDGPRDAEGRRTRRVTEAKVRYLVLCYGIPYQITPDPTLEAARARDASQSPSTTEPAELRRSEAAVDSELAALPRSHNARGFVPNPAFGAATTAALHPTNGVLLVARLDAPYPETARALVDKALQAETDGFWGRAYFDLRNTSDPRFQPGERSLTAAAEVCRQLGFETTVDTLPQTLPPDFPLPQVAFYAGWYDEHVSGPFTQPEVEFMPGAFAFHLHSFSGARLRDPRLHWVGPLLTKGATITLGTVWEPYLEGAPDVGVFCDRLLRRGFTFGEAAYAAQAMLSWQTTVVGDPLYRPAGRPLPELHADLERRQSPLLEWSLLRLVDLNRASGQPLAALARFLEDHERRKSSALLTERLADLYAALGKPASAAATYEQALKLSPSPQQRLKIAEKAQAVR